MYFYDPVPYGPAVAKLLDDFINARRTSYEKTQQVLWKLYGYGIDRKTAFIFADIRKEELKRKMSANPELQEVDYFSYCKTCKHVDLKEDEYPCCECLEGDPMREGTRKPTKWEEKNKK